MELFYFLLSIILIAGGVLWIAAHEIRQRRRRAIEWQQFCSRFGGDQPAPPRKPIISTGSPAYEPDPREALLERIEDWQRRHPGPTARLSDRPGQGIV